MPHQKISLADLVSLDDWQKIQESFSESLGITLQTIDEHGKTLSKITGPKQLCTKIYNRDFLLMKLCGKPVLREGERISVREESNLKCPFDLDVYILPIRAAGKQIVAYLVVGPLILNKRRSEEEYARYIKDGKINIEDLMDALIEISVFSYSKIRSILTLLTDMFSYMAQTGYHKKRLGEIGQEVIEADPLFSTYYEEKVLSSLLNTCTLALDADSGSVMTVDKKTNHLHIKVASKLNDEAVSEAPIKMGEGIAGIAALNAEPIILPRDRGKNGIAKEMKRKYIKSSMIVPFNKANNGDVYGVINLNVIRKKRQFSQKDIAIMQELINFASIALLPVK